MNDKTEEKGNNESLAEGAAEGLQDDSSQQQETAAGETEELQKKTEESQKYHDLYLRSMAEMENLRKRTAREKEEYIKFATLPLVKKLLGVIDDLERALAMTDPDQENDSLYKGITMITTRLQEIVTAEGAEPLEAVGKPFDPQYHQPLAVEENSEYPENTVTEELQKGYLMHGRLIRPSLVKVSG